MTENEFILSDRLQKIRQIIGKYGEDNFYISFSGGKDSTVLSKLVDMALPDNNIPRVYADTGIELNMIRDFVYSMAEKDHRVEIIKPSIPIIPMLEAEGYPFKSKEHSYKWSVYSKGGIRLKEVQRYLGLSKRPKDTDITVKRYMCPNKLLFQFTNSYLKDGLKISDKCCIHLKENPLHEWQNRNNKPYGIVGLMHDEGGRRITAKCLTFQSNTLKAFQPLVPITKSWEEWFIKNYNVEICDIYKPPYNFPRTGCKGCPFIINLQEQLDVLQKYFPAERKQCEIIWKPVYDEYRRIGYRLKNDKVPGQYFFNERGEIIEE